MHRACRFWNEPLCCQVSAYRLSHRSRASRNNSMVLSYLCLSAPRARQLLTANEFRHTLSPHAPYFGQHKAHYILLIRSHAMGDDSLFLALERGQPLLNICPGLLTLHHLEDRLENVVKAGTDLLRAVAIAQSE